MAIRTVTDAIRYVGADDNTLALFENQYPVQPMGVSYNSYVILDEKIAVMDSVDARAAEEWLSNVARVLEGRRPDYLVVTHMEPDHSGSLMRLAQKYPETGTCAASSTCANGPCCARRPAGRTSLRCGVPHVTTLGEARQR